jgi:hypothetical protein
MANAVAAIARIRDCFSIVHSIYDYQADEAA